MCRTNKNLLAATDGVKVIDQCHNGQCLVQQYITRCAKFGDFDVVHCMDLVALSDAGARATTPPKDGQILGYQGRVARTFYNSEHERRALLEEYGLTADAPRLPRGLMEQIEKNLVHAERTDGTPAKVDRLILRNVHYVYCPLCFVTRTQNSRLLYHMDVLYRHLETTHAINDDFLADYAKMYTSYDCTWPGCRKELPVDSRDILHHWMVDHFEFRE